MSQKSPLGFGFGVLIEVAAVVAIVAVLPRIDLRPPMAAQAAPAFVQAIPAQPPVTEAPISPVSWTALDIRNGEATRVPYSEPVPSSPSPTSAPPTGSFATQASLMPPADSSRDPKYVVDRLDRASQQLVNSVGSAVSTASNSWTQTQKPAASPSAGPRQNSNASTAQMRPWLRY